MRISKQRRADIEIDEKQARKRRRKGASIGAVGRARNLLGWLNEEGSGRVAMQVQAESTSFAGRGAHQLFNSSKCGDKLAARLPRHLQA